MDGFFGHPHPGDLFGRNVKRSRCRGSGSSQEI
ncbi:hypothetical protein EIB18_14130 [Caulobacter vibrioides]|uniref:Uncharacterized protein n=1 Tax=Caulobacter vibrioides (strain ATCC 19089 / CIP 103742 / CB 15) TaxID=190650 RepID=Q9A506_CAUVC|nr:hypothetical protein CC_2665 [Caulobacter vibrioides CB15]AVG21603.1 hypothetical protein CA608_20370 [Caulobacter vibrioides]AVH77132.1 hypothetical protein CA607_20510 [Caulobacter vibrioides]AZH14841.1 hypothetical protein EIB18_14130 [Caulobacter vibrioides]PLR07729.1 hypothetical protein CVUC_19470 [Caulobacter vibrioides]